MKLKNFALAITLLTTSSAIFAHGYIESPASRAYKCKLGENTGCGAIQWEPQSIEQKSGFPSNPLPPDGELASGGIASFSGIDKQGLSIWSKTPIKAGLNNFVWYHTAKHKTTNWRYYITKQNWNPNQPLTRNSLELEPFCVIDGNGQAPTARETHQCNVPQRTGYQVIYGVWEIADTVNSFYQVVDVDFGNDNNGNGGGVVSEWNKQLAGQIAGKNLVKGDKVIARFFDNQGEVESFSTQLNIASDEQGDQNRWSYDLSNLINSTHKDIRAGVKDSNGEINPVFGSNSVFVKDNSRLTKVAISYEEQAPVITEEVVVSNLNASKIEDSKATLDFTAQVKGTVSFQAVVADSKGNQKGYVKQTIADTNQNIVISLANVEPGEYTLQYSATNKEGVLVKQDTQKFSLEGTTSGGGEATGKYDYTFPEGLKSYKAGTVVLQPKNGKTYQCKPFPYSGYCVQWNTGSTQFEPGVGSNWQDAWTIKN